MHNNRFRHRICLPLHLFVQKITVPLINNAPFKRTVHLFVFDYLFITNINHYTNNRKPIIKKFRFTIIVYIYICKCLH